VVEPVWPLNSMDAVFGIVASQSTSRQAGVVPLTHVAV
jgi:hypothetical protein